MTPNELVSALHDMKGSLVVMGVALFAAAIFLLYFQMRFSRPDIVATLFTGGMGMAGAFVFDLATPARTTLTITAWVLTSIAAAIISIETARIGMRIKKRIGDRAASGEKA